MKYFKIITDDQIVGVITSSNFRYINPTNGWLLTSNENLGQLVSYKNKLYRDYWMQPITINIYSYIVAQVQEITLEEYEALNTAVKINAVVIEEAEEEEELEEQVVVPESDITIDYLKDAKIKEMSIACRNMIESGFDLELRNEMHHFSLDTQDQLNLISLYTMAQTQSLIPYHADGEECIFYTSEEINEIVDTANAFKIYQTTYYNALKQYIKSLNTLEEIATISYGIEIPEDYQSDVLKMLQQ